MARFYTKPDVLATCQKMKCHVAKWERTAVFRRNLMGHDEPRRRRGVAGRHDAPAL